MSDAPATRLSLLVRLCDARDDEAWSQFVEIYAPLVYGYVRTRTSGRRRRRSDARCPPSSFGRDSPA